MSTSDDTTIRSARELGLALREARKRQALTQLELADGAGISRQHLVSVEQGKSTERLEELFALLELLGLTLTLSRRQPGLGARP